MPRKAKQLTKRDLDAMRRAAHRDPKFSRALADAGQPGLYVQARRGKVRFMFRYRPPDGGGRRNMQIDWYGAITLDQARRIAQGLRGQVAGGVDPQVARAEKQRVGVTVGEAVDGYLANFEELVAAGTKKRSSLASARRRLERHVLPRLGDLRLRDTTAEHVRRLHRSMMRTPVEANRVLSAFSAVFGWADRRGILPAGVPNPTKHVQRYTESGARRALTEEELRRLGEVLHEAQEKGGVEIQKNGSRQPKFHSIHPSLVLAVRLLALTGLRSGEVVGAGQRDRRGRREGLRWGDVDLDAGLVHLADSKTGRQTRVLGQAAIELLRAARARGATDGDPVCPGSKPDAPLVGTGRPRRYLWQAAGIVETPAGRADLHSLRHSFASVGADLHHGRYLGAISALLGHGHQAKSITERYIHGNPEALRPAADAIADEIAGLLGLAEPAKVLEFPGSEQ